MPCNTYSIPAKRCKVGSQLRKIENSVCSKCYALRGNFARPTVVNAMEKRLKAIQDPRWVDAMVFVLQAHEHSGFFRWHASGDLQSLGHLIKIAEIARRLPKIKFWLPTRELQILESFVQAGFIIPRNLIIRFSAAIIEHKPAVALLKRLGIQGSSVSRTVYSCPAPQQENECRTCRNCWDKRRLVITYKKH